MNNNINDRKAADDGKSQNGMITEAAGALALGHPDIKHVNTRFIREITDESIRYAADVILGGGLVAFPTETVYGLGANALDDSASKKIYAAKGRPSDNPLIIHLSDAADAEKYAVVSDTFYRIAEKFMPGPLTVILPKKDIIPYSVTGGLDTVAIRIPSNKIANRLIRAAGVPIAAPSANISGKPSPTSFYHVEHDMDGRADVIIDGGECDIGLESTIISISGDDIKLLRPGAVTVEMLEPFAAHVEIDKSITEKFDGKPLAPGMKYRHYAPDAPLVILDGEDEQVYKYLEDKKNCGIICYDEDTPLLMRENSVSIGHRCDLAEQGARLFDCLRSFGDVDVIYARMPDRNGIGLAVFNRLLKASGYTIKKL